MSADYVIRKEQRLVWTTGSGSLTAEDIEQHNARLRADPDFDPAFDNLVDFHTVERVDISTGAVVNFAHEVLFAPEARRAIVARSALLIGLARMYGVYEEIAIGSSRTHLFPDVPSALEWLGVVR